MLASGSFWVFGVAFRFFFENPWAKLITNELLLIGSIEESLPSRDVFAV